ncbi:GntR family transcriptional regulator [Streptomyces sp. NPDC056227]|uniref:GntR family transcriptional regulator n=1 Tax=Streptomyces sp. NPDC056227 TaxID=3345753 RepID=UPI0035D63005
MWTNCANRGIDLHLDLGSGRGARTRLEQALRQAVWDGRLTPGTQLPSSRVLAQDPGGARNTVTDAYDQLGFVRPITPLGKVRRWSGPDECGGVESVPSARGRRRVRG